MDLYIVPNQTMYIAGRNENARARTISALYSQLEYLIKEMYSNGFPRSTSIYMPAYVLAQMMLETDWGTSAVANDNNNYSGIKYINNPQLQRATPGIKSGSGYYANYPTFGDWVRDYVRVLSLNTGKLGRPIDATTANDFISRLRANKYFQDPNYATKYNAALRKVSEALQFGADQYSKFKTQRSQGQEKFTYTPGKGLTSNEEFDIDRKMKQLENWAKDNPIKASVSVAVALAILAKIFS